MTAFDKAWELAKMPFHGTTKRNARDIMEQGLMGSYQWDGSRIGMTTSDPLLALRYALRATKHGYRHDDDPDNDTPTVLHISDDAPGQRSHENALVYDAKGDNDIAVEPKYIQNVFEGNKDVDEDDVEDESFHELKRILREMRLE